CASDQGPNRDSSLGDLIASGIFVASYRAVPVEPYLSVRALALKGLGERFEASRERFGARGERWVRFRGRGGFSRFGAFFNDLVGEQQCGEQELPGFGQGAEAGQRLARLGV